MPLPWPVISSDGGDLATEERDAVRDLLNDFADRALARISPLGLPPHASPLWRPWSLVVVRDAEKVTATFAKLTGGIASITWLDRSTELLQPSELERAVREQLGMVVAAVVTLPLPGSPDRQRALDAAAERHVTEVERGARLDRLGDLTGVRHLEPHLREFLNDHPDPDHNVFVMMRFLASDRLDETHEALKDVLARRGFYAVRADDRDYTGELWSNIEVYMTCCHYGIAVFEDIEKRDFNPNVSLELGYMLGRRRRCLILKEQRLPDLPADVVHRLYKPFDMFNITASVSREVTRWVDVDLGVGAAGPA